MPFYYLGKATACAYETFRFLSRANSLLNNCLSHLRPALNINFLETGKAAKFGRRNIKLYMDSIARPRLVEIELEFQRVRKRPGSRN